MIKKILIIYILFTCVISFSQEKEMNLTIGGGIIQGKAKHFSNFGLETDFNYLFDIYEEFKIGPSLGVLYFNAKDIEGVEKNDSSIFLPVGFSIKFQTLEDSFFVGGDLGYAIAIAPENNKGGIYFKPYAGYNLNEQFKVSLSYNVVKQKSNSAAAFIGLNLTYDFGVNSGYY